MQFRTEKAVILGVHTDRLMNISFIKILTAEAIESVKLPTSLENYRLQHLLRPNYLLELELVKTKKNWILKNIVGHQVFCELNGYTDHLKLAEIISLLNKYSGEGQEVNILPYLVNRLSQNPISSLDLVNFESELLERLGFSPKLSRVDQPFHLHWAKSNSGLI